MGLADYIDLLEHLPRIGNLLTRVLPMLESAARRGPQTPSAPVSVGLDDEARASINGLRADIASASAAHGALLEHVQQHGEQLAAIASDSSAARGSVAALAANVAALDGRLELLEKRIKAIAVAQIAQVTQIVLLMLILGFVIALYIRH